MRIKAPVYTVIFVIGLLLAGMFLPKIIGKTESARIKTTQAQLGLLNKAVITFQSDVAELPSSLEALVSNINHLKDWNGPYIQKGLLKNPWGFRYIYESNGPIFQVISFGKDNKPGGEKFNADLVVQTNVDE